MPTDLLELPSEGVDLINDIPRSPYCYTEVITTLFIKAVPAHKGKREVKIDKLYYYRVI